MSLYRLRYFFDFDAGCLWADNDAARSRFGYPVDAGELPLSKATVEEIARIGEWLWTSLNPHYPPDPSPWREEECNRFNEAASRLFDTICCELGAEYEIVNEQMVMIEDADLNAYLTDPKGFRR